MNITEKAMNKEIIKNGEISDDELESAVGVLDYRRFSEVQIIEVYHAYGGF